MLKKLDHIIDEQCNNFKESEAYKKFRVQYNGLDDTYKEVIKSLIVLFCFLIPVFTFLIFSKIKSSSDKVIAAKQNFLQFSDSITLSQSSIKKSKSQVISNENIRTENDFQSLLKRVANTSGLDPALVETSSFDHFSPSLTLNKNLISVRIKDSNHKSILKMLKQLDLTYKIRATSFSMSKNESTQLYTALFDLVHLGENKE